MAKFLSIALVLALVALGFSVEVPSYIKICGRKNPKLNECIEDSVVSIRDKLRQGIPEFGVEPLEPLLLPNGLEIANTEAFKASAKNVKLYGTVDFKFKKIDLNLEKKTLDVDLSYDKLRIEGDYDVSARIIVPINAVGPIEITAENVTAESTMKFDFKDRKDGRHMVFTSMRTKITIGNYESRYISTPGQDSTLAVAINNVLNGSKKEIISTMTANIEKATAELVLDASSKINKKFSYDLLLPDRE